MKHLLLASSILLFFFNFLTADLSAQPNSSDLINFHIKCNNCDSYYIRQEIDYVNHVRDRAMADVQAFISQITNGSGGRTFELSFTGKNSFNGINQQLKYTTSPNQTRDEVRFGLLQRIKAGLSPYLLQAGMLEELEFDIVEGAGKNTVNQATDDPWNSWIFELRGEGGLEKESSRSGLDLEFGFESDRVTEDWRIKTAMELNYSQNRFVDEEEEIISTKKYNYLTSQVVRSLGNHWSAGVYGGLNHSSYRNLDISSNFGGALEYSLFPYREVIRREITFAYRVGHRFNKYLEATIYDKEQESLLNHSLSITMRFRQPWGDVYSSLRGSNYLHDFSKNRLDFNNYISIRVYKGLALRVSAQVDLIRDQISLPAGNASLEDLILRQRQIATDFEMELGVGLSYTFGSAFNNIVNTRL